MLKMILKDLRLSPLRSILTSVSMLVGIIAMIGSVLVGTLGREYLISVNAQVYGWSPTYSFVITESDFHDRNKMEQLFQRFEAIDDVAAVTFSMGEDIRFAPMKDLTPIPPNDVYQNLMAFDVVCTTEAYSQVYNLPMTSGRWLEPLSEGGSLEVVINKEAKNYFNDSPYAAGNVKKHTFVNPIQYCRSSKRWQGFSDYLCGFCGDPQFRTSNVASTKCKCVLASHNRTDNRTDTFCPWRHFD